VASEPADGGIEGRSALLGSGDNEGALEGAGHELCDFVSINSGDQRVSGLVEQRLDAVDRDIKELAGFGPHQGVRFAELGCEAARRGTEGEITGHQSLPVVIENGEDSLDRVVGGFRGRFENFGFETLGGPFEHCRGEVLLGREEVVEAAAGGPGTLHNLVNPGLPVTLARKEIGGGADQSVPGCGSASHQLFLLNTPIE
jgi:hypothetical protein